MNYKPQRDGRFEYIADALAFVEEKQCRSCAYSKLLDPDASKYDAEEFPMCYEVEAEFWAETNMDYIEDRGDEGIHCKRYRDKTLPDLTVENPLW